MEKIYLNKNEKGFHYFKIGSELHGRASALIWVNRGVVEVDDEGNAFARVEGLNREIVKTAKGNYVLRYSPDKNIFNIGRECGFRGSSSYEVLKGNIVLELPYEEWASERGSLGISSYALVVTPDNEIVVKETATGRLYGDDPEKTYRYFIDGDKVKKELVPNCIEDDELCDLL